MVGEGVELMLESSKQKNCSWGVHKCGIMTQASRAFRFHCLLLRDSLHLTVANVLICLWVKVEARHWLLELDDEHHCGAGNMVLNINMGYNCPRCILLYGHCCVQLRPDNLDVTIGKGLSY
jgi:hypothetical protein